MLDTKLPEKVYKKHLAELSNYIEQMKAALEDEITAVRKRLERWDGLDPVGSRSATLLERVSGSTIYEIEVDRGLNIPSETGALVEFGGFTYKGRVTDSDKASSTIKVAFSVTLPSDPSPANIMFDPTALLAELEERLSEIEENPQHWNTVLGAALFRSSLPFEVEPEILESKVSAMDSSLNSGQKNAVGLCSSLPFSLCFGPPGTGKTHTLSHLVSQLVEKQNERVLILAHTNRASDTALSKAIETLDPGYLSRGEIVRYGEPTPLVSEYGIGHKEIVNTLIERGELGLRSEIDRLERQLRRLNHQIPASKKKGREKQLKFKPNTKASFTERLASASAFVARLERTGILSGTSMDTDLMIIQESLSSLDKQYNEASGTVLGNAWVVGTTLTQATLAEAIYKQKWQAVLMDEASMAMLPHAFLAACMSRVRFGVFGDPRQLPPVIQAETPAAKEWLGRDVFTTSGAEDPSKDLNHRAFLNTQYRMDPVIRELISRVFYAGRLEDAPEVARRQNRLTSPLTLIDTSREGWTTEQVGSSRRNMASANLVVSLVETLISSGVDDIGIVTPFRSQSSHIWKSLKDAGIDMYSSPIEVGTVHRFQGREKDIVIFDTTDSPPLGRFLNERQSPDLPRLLNVALSRAQRGLFVIAHATAFRASFGNYSTFGQLLIGTHQLGRYVKAEDVLKGQVSLI